MYRTIWTARWPAGRRRQRSRRRMSAGFTSRAAAVPRSSTLISRATRLGEGHGLRQCGQCARRRGSPRRSVSPARPHRFRTNPARRTRRRPLPPRPAVADLVEDHHRSANWAASAPQRHALSTGGWTVGGSRGGQVPRCQSLGSVHVVGMVSPVLSGPGRKFVGGQAAAGCGAASCVARRSRRSSRSLVVYFQLNGRAAKL
jgi:hypothetical protein